MTRWIWTAKEARSLGYGRIETVAKATGIARSTIGRGVEEGRSEPSVRDAATIISLIAATATEACLKVSCSLDVTVFETGVKVTPEEMDSLDIRRDAFRGEWNYTLLARPEDNDNAVIDW